MSKQFLPFALPDLGQEEIDEVVDTLKSGWITTGPKTLKFEEQFKKYIGSQHALSLSSATAGLHLALEAIGVERGDKVITTAYTFTSSAEVIRYFDADPIFCDIDPETFNICPKKIEEILSALSEAELKKVKAIIPVHIAGLACDMTAIMDLAKKYNLKVIEDAAHSLPTTHKGKLVGNFGDITVFSFYATKTLATGEGGMATTDNEDYLKRMKVMRIHGFNRDSWNRYQSDKGSWYYEVVAPGYKYNLTDIQSSLGIHQLKKIERFYQRRNAIAKAYDEAFSDIKEVALPPRAVGEDKHAYHLYMMRVPASIRDQFINKMKERGIGTSVHFIPLHLQPYWRDKYQLKPDDFPLAKAVFESEVSMPIYTKMTDEQVDRVIKETKETLKSLL